MRLPKIFIIAIIASMTLSGESIFAACAIENGPPPEFANYIRETKEAALSLGAKYPNICGERKTSPLSSLNATLSILDKATILNSPGQSLPIMNSIITDFTYNVYVLSLGNTSPLVIRHGELLYQLEKNTIIPALDRLSNNCQLEGAAKNEIIALLRKNNEIQSFFKNTVIGNVSKGTTPFEEAIVKNYQGDAIANCSDKLDLTTAIEKGTQSIEKFGTNLDEAIVNWKEAMALIRGSTTSSKKNYNELQKELLQKELQRQGLSQDSIKQMINNLECMQTETTGAGNIEDWTRARAKCISNPIMGYNKIVEVWNDIKWGISQKSNQFQSLFIEKPKTSDEFIRVENTINSHVSVEKAIISTYGLLQTEISLWDQETTNNTITTNLINMHASLVGINGYFEKRIPKMQENCMKGNPGIVGGCYIR